jgi:hypothetical protein
MVALLVLFRTDFDKTLVSLFKFVQTSHAVFAVV